MKLLAVSGALSKNISALNAPLFVSKTVVGFGIALSLVGWFKFVGCDPPGLGFSAALEGVWVESKVLEWTVGWPDWRQPLTKIKPITRETIWNFIFTYNVSY